MDGQQLVAMMDAHALQTAREDLEHDAWVVVVRTLDQVMAMGDQTPGCAYGPLAPAMAAELEATARSRLLTAPARLAGWCRLQVVVSVLPVFLELVAEDEPPTRPGPDEGHRRGQVHS